VHSRLKGIAYDVLAIESLLGNDRGQAPQHVPSGIDDHRLHNTDTFCYITKFIGVFQKESKLLMLTSSRLHTCDLRISA
jgi:hypothetical protein